MLRRFYLLSILSLFLSLQSALATLIDIELPSGAEINLHKLSAAKQVSTGIQILWISSEFGLLGREQQHLERYAQAGFDVWLPNLHTSYFVPAGRKSYQDIPVEDIEALIDHVVKASAKPVLLIANGRGAPLLLEAAHQWRRSHAGQNSLLGAMLYYPNFYRGIASAGSLPEYKAIIKYNQLPVFIMQPANSSRRWQLKMLIEAMESVQTPVFSWVLKDASDGFDIRQDTRTPDEDRYSQNLPVYAKRAVKMFKPYQARLAGEPVAEVVTLDKPAQQLALNDALIPFTPPKAGNVLSLENLAGKQHTLRQVGTKYILLNFWASWCPPCVRELPSLQRLQEKFDKKDFQVITVDVGEEPDVVRAYFKRLNVDLPVWMDPEGKTVLSWKVSAFPTSYVVNPDGQMYYGLFGALEWDKPEVVEQIRKLIRTGKAS